VAFIDEGSLFDELATIRPDRDAARSGDELPPELSTAQGPARLAAGSRAPPRWPARRAGAADPGVTPARLKEAKRRLEEELHVECRANAAYEGLRPRRTRHASGV